jgi:hypothetical protein
MMMMITRVHEAQALARAEAVTDGATCA